MQSLLTERTSALITGFGLFDLVIIALAAWRLSRLITQDSGPMMIFERLRYLVGVRRDEANFQLSPDGSFPRLVSCLDCFSVTAGVVFVAMGLWSPLAMMLLALPLAVSTLVITLDQWMR